MKLIINMKKQFLVILLILISVIDSNAQEIRKSRERIKALKIAFFTQELDLNTDTAQKFWPIYNKHEENLDALRQKGMSEVRKKLKNAGGLDALSEKEAKSFVSSRIELDKKIFAEKERFTLEIAKFMSYKKILKLQLSEREFTRKLMRKYRKKQKQ